MNAFINSLNNKLIYVRFPDGFHERGHCLKLLRALYGLLRSPLLWFNDLSACFKRLGLTQHPETPCVFSNDKIIAFFYINDIIILSYPRHREAYKTFRIKLLKAYKMREIGKLKWFLGIRVI